MFIKLNWHYLNCIAHFSFAQNALMVIHILLEMYEYINVFPNFMSFVCISVVDHRIRVHVMSVAQLLVVKTMRKQLITEMPEC